MDSIRSQSIRHSKLLCLMTVIVLCVCVFYAFSMSRNTIIKSTIKHSFQSNISSEQLCYSSINDVFTRDHLRTSSVHRGEGEGVSIS
jgi:hypothetical protein